MPREPRLRRCIDDDIFADADAMAYAICCCFAFDAACHFRFALMHGDADAFRHFDVSCRLFTPMLMPPLRV